MATTPKRRPVTATTRDRAHNNVLRRQAARQVYGPRIINARTAAAQPPGTAHSVPRPRNASPQPVFIPSQVPNAVFIPQQRDNGGHGRA